MPIIVAVEAKFPLGCNEKLPDHSIPLTTSVEHRAAVISYRFHVTYAHHNLIERLIGGLKKRMSACRRSAVSWTPLPACDADLDFAPERLKRLSRRTTRASDLL